MPTTSVIDDFVFGNLGPLTTTFTAPASCATIPPQPVIYQAKNTKYPFPSKEAAATTVYPDQWRLGSVRCGEDPRDECIPSAQGYQKSHVNGQTLAYNYYSPGVYCPSGYTTAGVKAGTSASGIFTQTGSFTVASDVGLNWIAGKSLSPDETMALCVASGYTAHPFVPGVASSTITTPLSLYTALCEPQHQSPTLVTVTADGTTRVDVRVTETGSPEYHTRSLDAALAPSTGYPELGSEPDQYSGEAQVFDERPIVVLVHRQEDIDKAAHTKGDDDKGAASTVRPSIWAYAGVPVVVAALGAVMGMQV